MLRLRAGRSPSARPIHHARARAELRLHAWCVILLGRLVPGDARGHLALAALSGARDAAAEVMRLSGAS